MENKKSKMPQFLIAVLVGSFGFSGLCAYAIEKAQAEDPELNQKIESALQKHFDNKNIHFNVEWNTGAKSKSTQVFDMPINEIQLTTTSGDVQFKAIPGATQTTVKISGGVKAPPQLQVTDQKVLALQTAQSFQKSDLVVELPENFKGVISVQTVSGDIGIDETLIQNIKIETVSGDIQLKQTSASKYALKTVSGDIDMKQKIAGDVVVNSISGDVDLKLSKATEGFSFDIKTVSGDVMNSVEQRSAGNTQISISTTSGDIEIH